MWCSIIGVILLLIGFIGALALRTEWGIALGIIGIAGAAITMFSCIRLMTQESAEEEDDDEEEDSPADAPAESKPDAAAPAEPNPEETAPPSEPASAPLKTDEPEPPMQAEADEQNKPEPLKEPAEAPAQPPAAQTPYEQPTPYKRGLRYLYSNDLRKAAGCFVEGYEKGDLNAGYMLCHCYSEGKGVPVKPAFVVQLAEYLVKQRYYPAYHHLSIAYREGRGVPMNLPLASEYSQKFENLCSSPIEGVDEFVRYDALIDHETRKNNPDMRILEKLARENFAISSQPSRYSILALPLLRDAACSLSARKEAVRLLEEGMKANDMGSYYLHGLLLCSDTPLLYKQNVEEGLRILSFSTSKLGTPSALQSYLNLIQGKPTADGVSLKLRDICRWGVSCIKGSDELNCRISLISPASPIPDVKTPFICIDNENDVALHDACLRICCIDKKVEHSIKLPPLQARDTLIISPDEYQIELGNQLYIELLKDNRSSRLLFHHVDVLQKFSSRAAYYMKKKIRQLTALRAHRTWHTPQPPENHE